MLDLNKMKKMYHISKKLKVLYVEDDLVLQNKSKILFNNFFKRIDVANDGLEALKKYEDYKKTKNLYYDLVITDIKMPNLDGVALVKKIFSINRDQKIIVTSAYSETDDLISFINLGISKFIQKPFTTKQITEVLMDTLLQHVAKDPIDNNYTLDEELIWHKDTKELKFKGDNIKLSYNQIMIMDLLINNPQHTFSSLDIFKLLNNETNGKKEKDFSIDSIKSIIKRLRHKIPYDIIENIYGFGYKLKDKAEPKKIKGEPLITK